MNDFQPRQPRGIPIGGQFATASRGESGVHLSTEAAPSTSTLDHIFGTAERHDALLARGYVPPTYFAAIDDPHSTAMRADWWAQSFISAEHNPDGDGYPTIPDDYTPSKRAGAVLPGQSLEGHRRAHRPKFSVGGVTIRTHSKTTIKAFTRESGGTVRMPFSAVDEKTGRKISGHVLVTNNGAGVWSVQGQGFSGSTNAMICEAIASRLEARRPARAPRATGDLIEAHKARLAAQGARLQEVKSTWISGIGYNPEAGVMFTETSNGKSYGHHVDPETFEKVRRDRSPGAVFNELVKGSPVAAVGDCPRCQAKYALSNGHTCKVDLKAPAPGPKAANVTQRNAAEAIARGLRGAPPVQGPLAARVTPSTPEESPDPKAPGSLA